MREILFRGKRVDNGEWETGSLVYARMGTSEEQASIADKMTAYHTPVIPESIGQYTGLKDKNGKRIFEGDILIYVVDGEHDVNEKYLVVFDDDEAAFRTKFYCEGKYMCYEDIIPCENFEIIGNIYGNKNLLKNQEVGE